jgi:hypothetical protein
LHIRTHTADTIPLFESYAQSDDAPTPTTLSKTTSSPFVEDSHAWPNLRSSRQDNSTLQGSDPTELNQELKLQACPLNGEFNSISPKASSVNLRSPRNRFSYCPGADPPRFSTQSRIPPPSAPAKSPRFSTLNTSRASEFSESRPYDPPSQQHARTMNRSRKHSTLQHNLESHDAPHITQW